MEPKQKQKRLVSKSEFAKIQSIRLGLSATSLCLLSLMVCSFAVTVVCIQSLIVRITYSSHIYNVYIGMLSLGFLSGCGGLFSWKLLVASVKKTKALGKVVPFTRANTADLPAPDSLVRASEKPVQAQADMLLRAATDVQQAAPEQLLRATTGEEVRS